jgi:hypothetical protein
MLAGLGTQSAMEGVRDGKIRLANWRVGQRLERVSLLLAIFGLPSLVIGTGRGFLGRFNGLHLPDPPVLLVWAALLAAALMLYASGKKWSLSLVAVLLAVELLVASDTTALNDGNLAEAYTAVRPSIAHLQADPDLSRTIAFTANTFDPGDLGEMRYMLKDVLRTEGIYDYIVATKHRETLTPNLPLAYGIPSLDGYDGGMLPLRDYVEFKSLLPITGSAAPDARLREQFGAIPDPTLLGGLNVKHILMDRTQDVWLENIYYDLAITTTLQPGQEISLPAGGAFRATALGLLSYLEGAANLANGSPIGVMEIQTEDGANFTIELRAGQQSAEGGAGVASAVHDRPPEAGTSNAYYTRLELPSFRYLKHIRLRYTADIGVLHLRSLSAIDGRAKAGYSIGISPWWRLAHLGDVKIYENLLWLPRAYLTHTTHTSRGWPESLTIMGRDDFVWGRSAVVEGQPPPMTDPHMDGHEWLEIVSYAPEQVVIRANAASAGLLVLSDSYYPGWRATDNGEEVALWRVNHSMKAVALEPGLHTVVFYFQPRSVYLGLGISLASIVLLLSTILVRHHNWFRR